LLVSRRVFIGGAVAGLSAGRVAARAAVAPAGHSGIAMDPQLLQRALAALRQHERRIAFQDHIGVADFGRPSREPRFHLVNLAEGSVRSHLVAHGRGSDPARTGWLQRFSNEPHSYATSAGAYLTGALYTGAHGHSLRLEGLDATNSNALARAIVVHAAWYVNDAVADYSGILGRSEGCFAVAGSSLPEILAHLGPGRLIYADRAPHTV
jgi:L,D-transpeptidase catalytic domain